MDTFGLIAVSFPVNKDLCFKATELLGKVYEGEWWLFELRYKMALTFGDVSPLLFFRKQL